MRELGVRAVQFATVLLVVGWADRITKWWALDELRGRPARSYLGGILRVGYAENTGVFLGLGDGLPPAVRFALFVVVVGVTLAVVSVYLIGSPQVSAWRRFWLSMIVAGGVGNLIDRVAYDGVVVDFLNVGWGGLRTGVFNVADMAVTAGVLAILAEGLRPHGESGRSQVPDPAGAQAPGGTVEAGAGAGPSEPRASRTKR